MQTAHAIAAGRGEWVTNEKRLLDRAGLRDIDEIVGGLTDDPAALSRAVDAARDLFTTADAADSGS